MQIKTCSFNFKHTALTCFMKNLYCIIVVQHILINYIVLFFFFLSLARAAFQFSRCLTNSAARLNYKIISDKDPEMDTKSIIDRTAYHIFMTELIRGKGFSLSLFELSCMKFLT